MRISEWSLQQERINNTYIEILVYGQELMNSAKQCYIKNAAMCCYIPMMPDWNGQGERLREEQEKLHDIMANYDVTRGKFIKLTEQLSGPYPDIPTSHEIVESALRELFSK